MSNYIQSLAQEYLDLIDNIASGKYSEEELRLMESERSVLHEQLKSVIGVEVPERDMPKYARMDILHD